MVAKLIVFARARISGVTSSWGTPKMIAAVWRWMSPPCSKARTNAGSPDRLAARRPHGDVLEIRIRGRQAAGGGAGLVVAGMDSPGSGIDEPRQSVHVGRLELRKLAVLDQQARDLVPHGGELLQYVVIGGRSGLRLLEDGKLVLLEQDVAQLRSRVDVELGTRRPVDRAL